MKDNILHVWKENSDWMEKKFVHIDIKKTFFTMEVKHWRRLHREAVKPSSHGILKTQPDAALINLI